MKTKKLNTAKLCSKTSAAYISIGLFTIAVCTGYNLKAQDNTAYGTDALKRVTTGDRNAAFGYRSLYSNTTGSHNTASGHSALYSNTEGWANAASGYLALYSNTTGSRNTASGRAALYSNTEGWNNTASGYLALYSNTTGSRNTASGHSALYSNTEGWNNTASGYSALYSNTTGFRNTASGHSALYSNTTGSNNTALGFYADVAKGDLTNATAIGANATVSESNAIQLGNDSVTKVYAGVGKNATLITGGLQVTGGTPAVGKVLTSDASGTATWQSTASTSWSLIGNTSTIDGVNFIGTTGNVPFNIRVNNQKAGRIENDISIDKRKANTFYGYQAGNANAAGYNTANGYQALYANTTGDGNTAIGDRSLLANTTGNYNTAIGSLALKSNVDGNYNTAIGYTADVQKGFNNSTAIGNNAIINGSNSTAIGNNTIVNASDKIRLGDAGVKVIEGTVMYTVSDGRFKTNINEEEVKGLAFIQKLRPVVYNFDTKKFQAFLTQNMPADARQKYMDKDFSASTAIRQSGFIAQEVEKAAQEVGYDFNGIHKPENANDNYSLAYGQFVVPLVKGMQEQQKQIEEQKQEIKDQQKQIDELKKLVTQITGGNNATKDVATKEVGTANTEDINLYPNPTTGIFTITASRIDNGVIEIYDMAGNSMQKTTFNNAKSGYKLNVSGYAKGVYLLNIIANNKKYTKRLVIQ